MLFKNRKSHVLNFALILALLGGMFGLVPVVQASTLTVINTNDSGAGSLRQAITNAVSGDTITFDPSLSGQVMTLSSNLLIHKDLIIDGSGLSSQVTLSGNSGSRIIQILGSPSVTISNLKFINGFSASSGGVIYSTGDLTVINSTFTNNASSSGGAIYSTTNLTVI